MKTASPLRPLIAAALFLFSSGLLCAQAWQISAGAFVENNGNVRTGLALAGGLTLDTTITNSISAGLKFDAGSDFRGLVSLETALFGRWYFFKGESLQLYAQAGAGTVIFVENDQALQTFVAEGGLGVRIPIKRLYIEPYLRFGYPVGVGFGMVAGWSFYSAPKEKEGNKEEGL
jgi:hypothetical protein